MSPNKLVKSARIARPTRKRPSRLLAAYQQRYVSENECT